MRESTDRRKPASKFARHVAGGVAGWLFSKGRGGRGDRLVIERADGREVGSWTEGEIAHLLAYLLDAVRGLPTKESVSTTTDSQADATQSGSPPQPGTSR